MKRAILLTLAALAAALAAFSVDLAAGERPAIAAFSGKNGQIAFVSNRDGNEEIYVMNADGTDQSPLTDNPADDFKPDWAPVHYDFSGFYEPVNNLPTTNVVNAGRAVPMKFGLGDDQGLGISPRTIPSPSRSIANRRRLSTFSSRPRPRKIAASLMMRQPASTPTCGRPERPGTALAGNSS